MRSIRRQLTRALVGALALLIGAALAVPAWWVRRDLIAAFDASLHARAQSVAALAEIENGHLQFDFSEELLRGFGRRKARYFFEVTDDKGTPVARSPSLDQGRLGWQPTEDSPHAQSRRLTLPTGHTGRAVGFTFRATAIDRTPTPPMTLRVVVAGDTEELDETLGGLLLAVAGCGAVLLIAVFVIVPRVLRRGLAPLERLAGDVAKIDANSLAARVAVDELPAELRPIAERLNDLLARLEGAFERERRFSADLAHELRTPLAELRSLAECALKWPETREAANDRETLAIAEHMEGLVVRMLTLARGERGQLLAEKTELEIAKLVADAWRPFAERARAREIRASLDVAPGVLRGDPVLLRAVLANLFDNAVAHAPAGADLRVTGTKTARGYALRVANPAGPLASADVAVMFDRFWRKEAARSGGGQHVGLGLSLARMFANATGWRLDAAIDEKGWLVFSLDEGGQ